MVNFKPGFSQILSEIFPSSNKLLMGLFQPKMTVLSNLQEGNRALGYFNTYLGLIDLRGIWPRVLFVIVQNAFKLGSHRFSVAL